MYLLYLPLSNWTDRSEQRSTDPDQILNNAASDQGLQCLALIKHYFKSDHVVKLN